MAYIYFYDNNTGRDIPDKVNTYEASVLLGTSIKEVKNNIADNAKLFCVFSHIVGSDFIVTTNSDKERLEEIINFGKYSYTVEVKKENVWFSDKADQNIIISDSVNLDKYELSKLLSLFISSTESYVKNTSEMYIVTNERNGKLIIKTPIYIEAVSNCDANPCTVIKKKSTGDIIYRSNFGKVAIPYTSEASKKKVVHKVFSVNSGTRFIIR